VHQRHKSQQEIRGSAAEGSAVRPGSHTKVSVPLVLPQNRHPERSASQIDRVTHRLGRGVEGPRGYLINECSAGLSGHQNREQIEKVTPSATLPGFPVEVGGVGKPHAAFLTEGRTSGCW
jgi:hypothetical protein